MPQAFKQTINRKNLARCKLAGFNWFPRVERARTKRNEQRQNVEHCVDKMHVVVSGAGTCPAYRENKKRYKSNATTLLPSLFWFHHKVHFMSNQPHPPLKAPSSSVSLKKCFFFFFSFFTLYFTLIKSHCE